MFQPRVVVREPNSDSEAQSIQALEKRVPNGGGWMVWDLQRFWLAMMKQGKIVALDSTRALLKSHAAKQLSLRLAGALPNQLQSLLKQQNGDEFVLALSELSQVETVLRTLREANVMVQDMQLQEVDLEDVFLNLVGNQKGAQA